MTLKKFKLILIGSFIILTGLTSCGKNNDTSPTNTKCNNNNWATLVEKELKSFMDLALDYALDPSKANCDKYKKAGLDYIDALAEIKTCVTTYGLSDYNKQIEEAKKTIQEIDCQ